MINHGYEKFFILLSRKIRKQPLCRMICMGLHESKKEKEATFSEINLFCFRRTVELKSEPHPRVIKLGVRCISPIIRCRRCLLVDPRGVEPLSENRFIQPSPSAFCLLDSPYRTPANRLAKRVAFLFMTASKANGLCTFTAK